MKRVKMRKRERNEMIGVLGHDSDLQGYSGPETTWAYKMNFVMNYAPGEERKNEKEKERERE